MLALLAAGAAWAGVRGVGAPSSAPVGQGRAAEFIEAGFEALVEGTFTIAAMRFRQALDGGASSARLRGMLLRLETVVRLVPLAEGHDEAAATLRDGIRAYVENRDPRAAILGLRRAQAFHSADERLLQLLKIAEREARLPELSQRPSREFSETVTRRLVAAREAVERRSYHAAWRHLEAVLELEPQSIQALQLLGSLHLERGDKEEARRAFEEILRLDPHDATVLQAIELVR